MNGNLSEWHIKSIETVEIYDSPKQTISKDIPDYQKVSALEFATFLKGKELHNYTDTISGRVGFIDDFGNMVAYAWIGRSDIGTAYYINPDLYNRNKKKLNTIIDKFNSIPCQSFLIKKDEIQKIKNFILQDGKNNDKD